MAGWMVRDVFAMGCLHITLLALLEHGWLGGLDRWLDSWVADDAHGTAALLSTYRRVGWMGGRFATSLVVGDEDGVRNPRHRTQQGEEMLRVDGRLFLFLPSFVIVIIIAIIDCAVH